MAMYCCMHEVTSLFLLFCWFRINCVNIHSSLDVMMVVVDETKWSFVVVKTQRGHTNEMVQVCIKLTLLR